MPKDGLPAQVCAPASVADAAQALDPLPAAACRFVAARSPVRLDRVALHTRLAEDLHVQGVDDAVALMERVFDRFDVDPAGFQFVRFVTPEGVWPGRVLLLLLLLPVLLA